MGGGWSYAKAMEVFKDLWVKILKKINYEKLKLRTNSEDRFSE